MFRKLGILLTVLLPLITLASGANADQCRRGLPPNGILASAFCIDGDLPPGGRDILTWTLSKVQSRHSWRWSLNGPDGAVTRLEIFAAKQHDQKPLYTLLDRAPLTEENPRIFRAGTTDTIMLRPGRYRLRVSCDAPCTGKGDPYTLKAVANSNDLPGYLREWPLAARQTQAQSVPDWFHLGGNLQGREGVYSWTIAKGDVATCWRMFLFLPVGVQGWLRLYDPDGRLVASVPANDANQSKAAFRDLGVYAGRYTIRVGPAQTKDTPYRLFSGVLGTRVMKPELSGSTLSCPVLNVD